MTSSSEPTEAHNEILFSLPWINPAAPISTPSRATILLAMNATNDDPFASPIIWTDSARASAFSNWLQGLQVKHGLVPNSLRPASADASFRRYFRIDSSNQRSFIIMDAPPAQEDSQSFVKVAQLMRDAKLNVPEVLDWEQSLGFMLLSDLGDKTMMDGMQTPPELLCTQPASLAMPAAPSPAQYALYMQAVDALIVWQLASKPGVLPEYDDALLSRELALFPDWYVAKHRGFVMDAEQTETLKLAFEQIKTNCLTSLGGARVYVHRDFMPRNLMPAPAGLVIELGLGVLDFQDAVYGPISYDIASLMRDAFLSWEEDVVLDITVRYWQKARKAGLPVGDDFGEFFRAVEWMGLQRHLKILGIFARLTLRDGKPKYLADTPRFMRYARATCARYRQLGPFMVLLDAIEGNETRIGYTF
ncbi:N-acetylmuramate/N-acetylglucosamine kinase [Polaromonas vacuolata]|uniref:N-acetylmuramate/N-acetylglucosamine kinase n=2 Tax=Polaromonas vacuolata TaxID=37448 RepID=A0A6H2HE68_9BURK|nr:N-acetylmuramate/N-acetylglucosamine kinase [Polaromonas vacuolata]